jgi:hypothetical protein
METDADSYEKLAASIFRVKAVSVSRQSGRAAVTQNWGRGSSSNFVGTNRSADAHRMG